MNCAEIIPSRVLGSVNVPSSKSLSHRAVIAAGLAKGSSILKNITMSKDIEATINAMKALGCKINVKDDIIYTESEGIIKLKENIINCNESGSTLRFLIPLALLQDKGVTFCGEGRLSTRPLLPYYRIFEKQNIAFNTNKGLPLTLHGSLKPGLFEIEGNISSQFITGLLFALPCLSNDSKIIVTTPLESKGYVDLTIQILNKFKISVQNNSYKQFLIKGNQEYKCCDYEAEGDYSQAAFFIAAGIIAGSVKCNGLTKNTLQNDSMIVDIVKKMGGDIKQNDNSITANNSKTNGIDIDVSECPDLVPILAVLGAVSKGTTRILNAARLRLKESDRLNAIATEINKLGGDVTEYPDSLVINGKEYLNGGEVYGWNDHRIVMALAVASLKCKNKVVINGCEAINKSYPEFFKDFESIGGVAHERNLG